VRKRMRAVVAARRGGRVPEAPEGRWPLAEPFRIGPVRVDNRIVQAPLAGIANAAYRRQSRRHGAGLVVSEMVSAKALVHGNPRTHDMISIGADEQPAAVQLLGSEPGVMAEAARMVEAAGAVAIDVNLGCPVKKICKSGAGAALLDDPPAIARIVAAMARAVRVPVTVKMRRGTTVRDARPVEVARTAAEAGAAAVFFHPRAAAEEYAGVADHSTTAEVAAAVEVPVVASGDVVDAASALSTLERSGCAAVAIGRGGLGNPWIYGDLVGRRAPGPRPLPEIVAELLGFADDVATVLGERTASVYLRKFYPWYLAGHDVGGAVVDALVTAETRQDARRILERLVEAPVAA